MSLFETGIAQDAPLAERMRPRHLDELIGQEKAFGKGTFLRRALERGTLPSFVLWGPPGCGKTTLAFLVASTANAEFVPLSAVLSGVKDIREVVQQAKERRFTGRRTLLFVDEIHRFNKSQQDAFLPHVEDGTLVLVGATTENPSFELNAALLSRARVVRLERLGVDALARIVQHAAATPPPRGLGGREVTDEAAQLIAGFADGDARRALSLLEAAHQHVQSSEAEGKNGGGADAPLTPAVVELVAPHGAVRHDRGGDMHYDVVSALIKSLRGSDPDAALYWLARLLEGGEPPRFLWRRLIVFAAEDVGLADPRAVEVAVAGAQGFDQVGMPEGRILLAQVTAFLATSPKSNRAYLGLEEAAKVVRGTGALEVPLHLRNAPTGLMSSLGHGQGYLYPHDYGGYVKQRYLPDALVGRQFYCPTENGHEARVKAWLDHIRAREAPVEG